MSDSTDPRGGAGAGVMARKGSLGQMARAVAWSFFGVRRRADLEHDVQKLNPVHLVVAGLIGGALFVALLVIVVSWVVGSGVAR
jgi:hypothetical protein